MLEKLDSRYPVERARNESADEEWIEMADMCACDDKGAVPARSLGADCANAHGAKQNKASTKMTKRIRPIHEIGSKDTASKCVGQYAARRCGREMS
jgi:hypothetical protein